MTSRTVLSSPPRAAILLTHQRVGCRRQIFASFAAMVLNRIDKLLRMFDTHPHRKRFRLDTNPVIYQRLIDVMRRMACRQYDGRTGNPLLEGVG